MQYIHNRPPNNLQSDFYIGRKVPTWPHCICDDIARCHARYSDSDAFSLKPKESLKAGDFGHGLPRQAMPFSDCVSSVQVCQSWKAYNVAARSPTFGRGPMQILYQSSPKMFLQFWNVTLPSSKSWSIRTSGHNQGWEKGLGSFSEMMRRCFDSGRRFGAQKPASTVLWSSSHVWKPLLRY